MFFVQIDTDSVLQVGEKFRIDVSKSFGTPDHAAITAVRIKPSATDSFIDVFSTKQSDWHTDWIYQTSGSKQITVEIEDGTDTFTGTYNLTVLTSAEDKLLSNDQDLISVEPEILKWLHKYRNNYNWAHRRAQKEILEQLYKDGRRTYENEKYTKAHILDIEEFRQWSTFLTLRIIFNSISNSIDDFFAKKSKDYLKDEHNWRTKSYLKIDRNADGEAGLDEAYNINHVELVYK